jgi:hypothetical protein
MTLLATIFHDEILTTKSTTKIWFSRVM